ncbi:hypothetical protein DB346_01215 [Verrucomicrobia bacterium LW23]|nr:hypothetical protein DB346_01215 [Verrucomicrobia bacterium LW23]
MTPSRNGLHALLLALQIVHVPILALAQNPAATPAPATPSGWDFASRILADEAIRDFQARARVEKDPAVLRELRLGEAVALINSQPKSEEKLDEAARKFDALIADNGKDDIAIAARYYKARIAQRHRYTPDEKEAARLYKELFADHPDHLFAQLGMVKYTMMRIHEPGIPAADRAARLAEAEELLPKITNRLPRRDLHAELGFAWLHASMGGNREKALAHFVEQNKLGIQRYSARADSLLRIANLAKELGKNDIAIAFYSRFIKEYPRDARNYTAVVLARECGAVIEAPVDAAGAGTPSTATPAAVPVQAPAPAIPPSPAAPSQP